MIFTVINEPKALGALKHTDQNGHMYAQELAAVYSTPGSNCTKNLIA